MFNRHLVALITIALAACVDPAAQQDAREREDARLKVLGDAMFYRICINKPVQLAGECRPWREAYGRDYAAFIAQYGATNQAP
jgi:hypothetical protein